jgi:hypothetical protein
VEEKEDSDAGINILAYLFMFFFIIPATLFLLALFLVIDISYLELGKSVLRQVGRSPIYLSLITTLLPFGIILLASFVFGFYGIKRKFISILREDKISALSDYVLVPFPADIETTKKRKEESDWLSSYYSDNRFLLIFPHERGKIIPPQKANWLSLFWAFNKHKVTAYRVLLGLILTLLTILVLKNYWLLSTGTKNRFLVHLSVDLVAVLLTLVLGSRLGKEVFKHKISCDWLGKGFYVVSDYLCVRLLTSKYVAICSWGEVYDSLKVCAEQTFNQYQQEVASKLLMSNQTELI